MRYLLTIILLTLGVNCFAASGVRPNAATATAMTDNMSIPADLPNSTTAIKVTGQGVSDYIQGKLSGVLAPSTHVHPFANTSTATGGFMSQADKITVSALGAIGNNIRYVDSNEGITTGISELKQLGGGTLVIASGTYSGTWELPDDIHVKGSGVNNTIIVKPSTSNMPVFYSASKKNNIISDMTINGNKQNRTTINGVDDITFIGSKSNPKTCQNIVLRNIEVKNSDNYPGISILRCENIVVDTIYMHDGKFKADKDTGYTPGYGGAGIVLWSSDMSNKSANAFFINNRIITQGLDGVLIDVDDVVIIGGSYSYMSGYNESNPAQDGGDAYFGGAGIYINANQTAAVNNLHIIGVELSNNFGNGLDLPNIGSIRVTSNNITNNTKSGIYIGTVSRGLFSNNIVTDNCRYKPNDAAISIGSVGSASFASNIIGNVSTTYQKYGMSLGTISTGFILSGNIFNGNVTSSFSSSYYGPIKITGNIGVDDYNNVNILKFYTSTNGPVYLNQTQFIVVSTSLGFYLPSVGDTVDGAIYYAYNGSSSSKTLSSRSGSVYFYGMGLNGASTLSVPAYTMIQCIPFKPNWYCK